FFHRTRVPLETSRIIETIDGPNFEQIRQRYAVEDPGEDWPKYLDLDRWIDINIRRIREIELDLSRPKRILDLGCGAGYFLHIAQLLGHNGLGLDLDYLPPRGRVWLELNREYDGTFYTPELREFFALRGAKIDEHKIIFNSGLGVPASAFPVGR